MRPRLRHTAKPPVPGGADAPRLSVITSAYRGFPWLLACCGAVAVYLLASGAIYLAVAQLALDACRSLGVNLRDEGFLTTLDLSLQFVSQMGCAAVFALWWKILAPRSLSFARRGYLRRDGASALRRVCGLMLIGVSVQMIVSLALTLLVSLIPHIIEEYSQMMEATGTNDLDVLSVLVVGVGAPLLEETMCRGVLLEFALRAVCPEWRPCWRRGVAREDRWRARSVAVPPVRFWVANVIQAALFGLLHINIVQVSYAFVIGLALGAVFWRTGRLRYNIALHAVVNMASFAVDPLWVVLMAFGTVGAFIVLGALCTGGASLYRAGTVAFAGALPAADATDAGASSASATNSGAAPAAGSGARPASGAGTACPSTRGDTLP